MKTAILAALLCWAAISGVNAADTRSAAAIVCASDAPANVKLAAKEVRRYVYLRTGELLPIAADNGTIALTVDKALGPQTYRLKGDGTRLSISGGSDVAVLYGAYAFAEKLGVRFYLHGDVVPDGRIPFALPQLDETRAPFFDLRGIQPFHDFAEGPDWWTQDDYLAHVSQLAKMRMNFLGLHCYPEGLPYAEPLIWHGLPQDLADDGAVKFSYPAMWVTTDAPGNVWRYASAKTSEFAGGASLLFPADDYGPTVQAPSMRLPKTTEEANAVFNGVGRMMGVVVREAHRLGVKVCVGTETPIKLPKVLREHLTALGKKPDDRAVVNEVYRGTFEWVKKNIAPDYYWLWTPEGWTWGGNNPQQFAATTNDIQSALDQIKAMGSPFTLATSGWVLGPAHDRAALDAFLPKDSPMSCINRQVGHDGVEPAFANIVDRPKWAIPWMENDPMLTQPQPWVARMRYDAADAKRLGCTGLFGIHWRAKAMMQNVAALADAAWDQSWVPSTFDTKPVKPQGASDGALGGAVASFTDPVAGTTHAALYQDVRYNLNGYNVAVPDGTYRVTLQFNEPHYNAAGMRVFGAKIQGREVIDTLDVFAKVGKNKALDFAFDGIEVTNGMLRIEFVRKTEFPCIAAIAIEGTTRAINQLAGQPFARRINCGGGAADGYEADRVAGAAGAAGMGRGMPVADFYRDFAGASFGNAVAEKAGDIMASVDGVKMPKITDWKSGPGDIVPNGAPWEQAKARFAFVDDFEKLRPQVVGAGNLARFDYWLNTYKTARAMLQAGCLRGELDRAVIAMNAEKDAAKKKERAAEALAVRVRAAKQWAELMSYQAAACDTPGELGTIENLETRSRKHQRLFEAHDAAIAAALGTPLPAEAIPSASYAGAPRIAVLTVRTQVAAGETMNVPVVVLDNQPAKSAGLYWRPMGRGEFQKVDLKQVGRAVYSAALPAQSDDCEYYIAAETAAGAKLVWPATAPEMNQTVVVR